MTSVVNMYLMIASHIFICYRVQWKYSIIIDLDSVVIKCIQIE